MITITAVGRLAAQPEVKLVGQGTSVCEFRLLSNRLAKGQEVTEAVTFFCYGEMAEDFASRTVKGQEIHATGVQETSHYEKDGVPREKVKYRLTWYKPSYKPRSERAGGDAEPRPQSRGYPSQTRSAAPSGQRAAGGYREGTQPPAAASSGGADDAPFY